MRLLISGGGTAGHINPALAIADYAKKHANAEILFVGTERGLEKTLVEKAGYNIEYIEVSGLVRKLTPENIKVVFKYINSIAKCKKIIKRFKPDAVIGTGGYVCAPVMSASAALGIPSVIHEQNVIPGVTVKMAAKKASCIATSFPGTEKYLPESAAKKCVLTGNPLDEKIFKLSYDEAREKLKLDRRPFVVMIGGSLGADRLNEAMASLINSDYADKIQFCGAVGKRYYEKAMASIDKEKLSDSIQVLPYIYNRDELYPAADLIIARAGAISVSEICALGKASILIPSPNVAHNHQEFNARNVADKGGAHMILESELTSDLFIKTVAEITGDAERMRSMGNAAKKMGITDANKRLFDIICNL